MFSAVNGDGPRTARSLPCAVSRLLYRAGIRRFLIVVVMERHFSRPARGRPFAHAACVHLSRACGAIWR